MKVCVVVGSTCGGGGGLGQLPSHSMLHNLLQFDGYANDSFIFFFHFVKTLKLLSFFNVYCSQAVKNVQGKGMN